MKNHYHVLYVMFLVLVAGGCREMLVAPADGRVVYITPSFSRGDVVACVEPAIKTPDSYKEVVDVVTEEAMSVESLPDKDIVRYGEFRRGIDIEGRTQFVSNRSVRIHNMREVLFELCQAYANRLIDFNAYSRMLTLVVEKTASLHAMEILLYHLDQGSYDQPTRDRLIALTRDVIYRHSLLSEASSKPAGPGE